MATAEAIRRETADLLARFEAEGAERVEPDILQPAEVLLDLYGEDIRARAYVTQDPLRGELMLRPDFTVPVVEAHMASGRDTARYTYAGPVFRRQDADLVRPSEYPQVGYEVFNGTTPPERAEAELFVALHEALSGLGLTAAMGDMAILRAAVTGLDTTEHRRAALMRHLWRPARFRALLDRYSGAAPGPQVPESGPEIGARSAAEVEERRARMAADAAAPRLDGDARAALEALMAIKGPVPAALEALGAAAKAMPGISQPVETLTRRVAALEAASIDVATLGFEVLYGQTSLEYYDGFVFGFSAPGVARVATGGRYDALTRILGGGRNVPAVGGVVRPDLVAALKEGSW